MSVRNEDFPLERDMFFGDTWLSEIMNQFNVSIAEQVAQTYQYLVICHCYYTEYCSMHERLFLNHHDLSNLCHLFNSIHQHSSTIIGREYIFYYYCKIVSDYGFSEPLQEQVDWFLVTMEDRNLTASVNLPPNHRYHQARIEDEANQH